MSSKQSTDNNLTKTNQQPESQEEHYLAFTGQQVKIVGLNHENVVTIDTSETVYSLLNYRLYTNEDKICLYFSTVLCNQIADIQKLLTLNTLRLWFTDPMGRSISGYEGKITNIEFATEGDTRKASVGCLNLIFDLSPSTLVPIYNHSHPIHPDVGDSEVVPLYHNPYPNNIDNEQEQESKAPKHSKK